MACFFALSLYAQNYVNLGLPSGTLWKDRNETGDFYTYAQAAGKYGNKLPTKWQWDELKDKCEWEWTGNGYIVTGKNGNSIFFPAAGCRTSAGYLKAVGSRGYYWGFTPDGLDGAIGVYMLSNEVGIIEDEREAGRSVRLVQ